MPATRRSPVPFVTRFSSSGIKGPVLMLASALLFTATDIIIKILQSTYRVWDIAFFRFAGGVVLMILLFGWFGNPFKGDNTRLLIVRGISGAMAFLTLVAAIQLLPLSSAIVIFYSFPAFAALFSAILYGERVSGLQLVSIFGILVGVAILMGFSPKGNFLGQMCGLLAAVFAGIAVCLIRKLRETNGPVIIYFYFCLMGGLMAFPRFMAGPRLPTSARGALLIFCLVAIFLAAQLLMNQGFKYCKSWEGGMFLSSEVFFSSLVGICFLGDPVTWRFWIGGSFIVGSVVLMNVVAAKSGGAGKPAAGASPVCASGGK